MATPPAKDELASLEEARARLEAALATDEYWCALRQPIAANAPAGAIAAHRARTVRLEKALAGNELYRAWKHLNHAIDALSARRPAPPAAMERAVPEPAPPRSTPADDTLRRFSEARLSRPRVITRLMRRLAAVAPAEDVPMSLPVAPSAPVPAAPAPVPERARRPAEPDEDYSLRPGLADPPEATVTFVVRESRRSLPRRPLPAPGPRS